MIPPPENDESIRRRPARYYMTLVSLVKFRLIARYDPKGLTKFNAGVTEGALISSPWKSRNQMSLAMFGYCLAHV